MKRFVWAVVCVVLVFGSVLPAAAELCKRCKGRMYIQNIGTCTSCGGHTTSGAFKLCPKCSAKLGKCEHCLTQFDVPQPEPEPKPIDFKKPGRHVFGKWQYEFKITLPGTRSEGQWGRLAYGGKELPAAEINDHYRTPWGPMYWVGKPDRLFGWHGWSPRPAGGQPQGRLLSPTDEEQDLTELGEENDGKTITMPEKRRFLVRLKGNPTTGYTWRTAELTGEAVEQLGKPAYVPRQHPPGMVGVGGRFVFKFQAVKPGTSQIKLEYVRPWEKDKPPIRTFTITVNVAAKR